MSIRLNLLSVSFPFEEERNLRTSKDFTSNSFAQRKVDKQVLCFFFTPQNTEQKRVPSKQLYFWGSESLMGYPLENCLGAVLKKVLIRSLCICGNWHFEDLRWLGWARCSSYKKRKGGQGLKLRGKTRRDGTYKERYFCLDLLFSTWKNWVWKKSK